ncbi:glycoside hydrolase family 31 protein [Streptomyces phaeochromogenes]|uniref:glycoside hydrolase family 31 protein n=1 Tax=Streptomyces phaeochromogenes TaxID=1923 RepID=UPI00386D4644|nr:glycoside hydrolase family 31 protein [Streptomyces phaeochromogenes]
MPTIGTRTVRSGSAALILAAPLLGTAPAAAHSGPLTFATPAYELRVATDRLAVTTVRAGGTVLATAPGAFRFRIGGDWHIVREVTGSTRDGNTLRVTAATDLPGVTVDLRITLRSDRYDMNWSLSGAQADALSTAYDLNSAGHWYGHGESSDQTVQPWPLDSGQLVDSGFSPASYQVVSPFWYTSSATGLRADTNDPMDVRINSGGNGLGEFTVTGERPAASTVFVEDTSAEVYRAHIALVGKPERSDTSYEQYATPLWNSWAQLYGEQNQENVLAWARALADAGLGGHAVQIEESVIAADFGERFPDLPALSEQLARLGFDLGMWTDLYMPETAANFSEAVDNGYLLKDPSDRTEPCLFTWWNGRRTGLIDLANPAVRQWYFDDLQAQTSELGVAGFKFDAAFFDDRCAPYRGATRADYVKYGTELADEFDQQGAGLRVAWNAAQSKGFATRTADKPTTFAGLRAAVSANLAVSTIGYPFVETDVIGGSLSYPPPTKEVLARWAQAASLMPLMYASTSPTGVRDATTGEWVGYDQETVDLYRKAIETHEKLAPYIWDQVQSTLKTGDPIMRPLFFDFPKDEASYTAADEWMLGPAVLAAPKLDEGTTRDVFLPSGTWRDVTNGKVVRGPVTLKGYAALLGVTPAFVNLKAEGATKAY